MKQLITLIVGALLLSAMSITSVSAADMKCGAGKCGASMKDGKAPADMKKPACCEAKTAELKKPACCNSKAEGKACTCPAQVACTCKDTKNCTCEAGKSAKKAPKAAMKCGNGKCG